MGRGLKRGVLHITRRSPDAFEPVDERVGGKLPRILKPHVHGDDGPLPEWTRALFAPLAPQADKGESCIVHVPNIEVDDLLDARPGVVGEE